MTELEFRRKDSAITPPGLVVCDVDRTLLTHDHRLLPTVVEAARALRDSGIPLVLASARSPTGLERVHSHVLASDTVVCFNGAWVGRLSTRESLAETRLDREVAREAMAFVHHMGGSPIWFLRDECVTHRSDEAVARRRTDVTGDKLRLIGATHDAPEAPYKILATFDPSLIDASVAVLAQRYSGRLEVAQSGPTLVEIVQPDARKDLAAQRVAQLFRLSAKDVAAAGDSDNDYRMLQWAGLSITVANAKPHIRDLADIVAASCDEGGIASAFSWLAALRPSQP